MSTDFLLPERMKIMDEKDIKLSGGINSADSEKSSENAGNENENHDISFKSEKNEQEKELDESVLNEKVTDLVSEKKISETEKNEPEEISENEDVTEEAETEEIIPDGNDENEDENGAEKSEKELEMISRMGLDELKSEEVSPENSKKKIIGETNVHKSSHKRVSDVKKENTVHHSETKKPAKKKHKKKSKINNSIFGGIIIITVILTVSILLAAGGISVGMEYWGIGKSDNNISFNIPKGATNDDIADLLVENGIINNKFLFKVALKIGNPAAIYPGDITLQPSQGYSGIISELSKMRESYKTVTITFAEGENLLDVANKLEKNGVCSASDFLFEFNKQQDFDFESKLKENKDAFYSMEGYFFPDTYNFYVDDTAYNITKTVREHFDKQITDKMYTRMKKLGLDLNQVMTLASIVQLESENTKEMPKVASVFMNTRNNSETFPMLQSDATKNYITKVIKKQSENIASVEHYTECYDTYQCKGLPSGPICNPGIDAINAVLYPAETDYYYFCNNLKTGKSYYAKTLEEHEKNLVKAGLK